MPKKSLRLRWRRRRKELVDDFAIKLESNGLFTFRIFNKILNFTHFIKTHPNAPSQLKEEVNNQFNEKSYNRAQTIIS